MKIEAQVIKIDEFTSKKGTHCAVIWCSIPGALLPMFKVFVFDDESIAKAKTAASAKSVLLFGIGAGSDLVPRLEVL